MATLNQPSTSEAPDATSDSDGMAGPAIQALGPPEGADPIEVSSDLSP